MLPRPSHPTLHTPPTFRTLNTCHPRPQRHPKPTSLARAPALAAPRFPRPSPLPPSCPSALLKPPCRTPTPLSPPVPPLIRSAAPARPRFCVRAPVPACLPSVRLGLSDPSIPAPLVWSCVTVLLRNAHLCSIASHEGLEGAGARRSQGPEDARRRRGRDHPHQCLRDWCAAPFIISRSIGNRSSGVCSQRRKLGVGQSSPHFKAASVHLRACRHATAIRAPGRVQIKRLR